MSRNLIDYIDEDDFESFKKLNHKNKQKFNQSRDPQEKIKKKRRESEKIKQDLTKDNYWND